MTTKQELYKLVDKLDETQLDYTKEVLTNIIQGNPIEKIPVCDLGSPEDITTLYESIVYNKSNKI